VSELPFVTAAGNVDRVVTPLCVLRCLDGMLDVESVHPFSSAEEVRLATGFPINAGPATSVTAVPSAAELAILREIDPTGVVAAEFHVR